MYYAITAAFAAFERAFQGLFQFIWWSIKTTVEMILFFIGQILLFIGKLICWACVFAFYGFIGAFIASFVAMIFKLGGLF